MKEIIIMSAKLIPTDNMDATGNCCEWTFLETSEEEYSADWNGDVRGYVENDLPDDMKISDEVFTIWNCPENAVIITLHGIPHSIFFTE